MSDIFAEAFNIGGAAGMAGRMIEEGISASEGLRMFRDQGGKIRNQTWYSTYGETRAAFSNRSALATLDPFSMPGDQHFTDWTVNNPRGVATQVTMTVRDRGSTDVMRRQYTHFSDGPVTPAEAIEAAMDDFSTGAAEGGSFAGQVIIGAAVTGLFRMKSAA